MYKVPPSVVCACSPRMGLTVNEPIDPAETGTENEFKTSQHGQHVFGKEAVSTPRG